MSTRHQCRGVTSESRTIILHYIFAGYKSSQISEFQEKELNIAKIKIVLLYIYIDITKLLISNPLQKSENKILAKFTVNLVSQNGPEQPKVNELAKLREQEMTGKKFGNPLCLRSGSRRKSRKIKGGAMCQIFIV